MYSIFGNLQLEALVGGQLMSSGVLFICSIIVIKIVLMIGNDYGIVSRQTPSH